MKAMKIIVALLLLFIIVLAGFGFFSEINVATPDRIEASDAFTPAPPTAEETPPADTPVSNPNGADKEPVKIPAFFNPYWTLTVNPAEIKKGDLVLVNNLYGFDPEDAENLVSIASGKNSSYRLTDKDGVLGAVVIKNLNRMMEGFFTVAGKNNVSILSSYRTIEKQKQIFDGKAKTSGVEEAKKWVASPGFSEHHTGMSFDLAVIVDGVAQTFTGNGDYGWFAKNCFKYGFIRRYPPEKVAVTKISYEPWHFRYVGHPHAEIMNSLGLCLEEYIDFLRDFPFGGEHYIYELGESVYEIYYIEGCEISLPKYKTAAISGNNVDGFIITSETAKPTE